MAGFRRLYRHRGKNGNRHIGNQKVFYLYLLSNFWLTCYFLSHPRFLAECEKLH